MLQDDKPSRTGTNVCIGLFILLFTSTLYWVCFPQKIKEIWGEVAGAWLGWVSMLNGSEGLEISTGWRQRERIPSWKQAGNCVGKKTVGEWREELSTCLSCCRFRVTHIGKKPTFPEPQDGAQPDGSREPSTEELEHSSERLRRERARNGTVPTGGLENGAVQGGAKSMELSRSSTPAPNTPGSRDGRAAGRVGSSPGSTSHQRRHPSRRDLGGSSPSIPGLLGQEGGQRGSICQEEAGLGSADEVSDIHGSLSLHEGAEELGREESSRRQPAAEAMGQQVGSSSSSSPDGRLGWRG